jgi:hypothetical protein
VSNRIVHLTRGSRKPYVPARSTLGGIRTRIHTALNHARLPVAARAHASRHPGSNRAIRRTKAKPQAVRGGEAAPHGFEPRFTASEAAVLPLDERAPSAEGAIRAHRPRGLSSRGLPVAVTPACAARGSNPVPLGKSQLHHHNACSAQNLTGELNPARQLGRLAHRH